VLLRFAGVDQLAGLVLPAGWRCRHLEVQNPYRHPLLHAVAATLHQPVHVSRSALDVFLATDPARGWPRGHVPVVALLYDVIPSLFGAQHFPRSPVTLLRRHGPRGAAGSLLERHLYRTAMNRLHRADRVVVLSERTRRDALRLVPGLEASRIAVVPAAPAPIFGSTAAEAQAASRAPVLAGIRPPYLLYVGGADPRKNVGGLLDAFLRLSAARPDLQLVLVGRDFAPGARTDRRLGARLQALAGSVHALGWVPEADLPPLYAQAAAFVFPSLYEGFGFPVLEAMACGAPVVACDGGAVGEVAGDAALLVEPGGDMAPAIERVLGDAALRRDLVRRGRERAGRYSWQQSAHRLLGVLAEVAA
jgi:glycosyltransferase involved in cell wall biosynthesis